MKKNGFTLIAVVFLTGIFLALGAILTKMVYNACGGVYSLRDREQAFFIAEGGLEQGKAALALNPGWYSDLPCASAGQPDWLIHQAVGKKACLGEGSFKMVREEGKNVLYAVGFKGKGIVIIRLRFSNPPFKSLEWEEL